MTAIQTIHACARQLGFDDATRRDFYAKTVGKRSLTDMSWREQQRVATAIRTQAGRSASRALYGKYLPKLQALWIAGFNLGVFRDRRDEALLIFVRRQTDVDHVRFLVEANEAEKVIEALKSWMAREAGVDWRLGRRRDVQDCVIEAQCRILGLAAEDDEADPCVQAYRAWRAGELDRDDKKRAMNILGARIRDARR
jgi:hypothetical protein